MRVLLSRRWRRPELGGIDKDVVCFRIKTHGLCAELGLNLSDFAISVGRILVEHMNPALTC